MQHVCYAANRKFARIDLVDDVRDRGAEQVPSCAWQAFAHCARPACWSWFAQWRGQEVSSTATQTSPLPDSWVHAPATLYATSLSHSADAVHKHLFGPVSGFYASGLLEHHRHGPGPLPACSKAALLSQAARVWPRVEVIRMTRVQGWGSFPGPCMLRQGCHRGTPFPAGWDCRPQPRTAAAWYQAPGPRRTTRPFTAYSQVLPGDIFSFINKAPSPGLRLHLERVLSCSCWPRILPKPSPQGPALHGLHLARPSRTSAPPATASDSN